MKRSEVYLLSDLCLVTAISLSLNFSSACDLHTSEATNQRPAVAHITQSDAGLSARCTRDCFFVRAPNLVVTRDPGPGNPIPPHSQSVDLVLTCPDMTPAVWSVVTPLPRLLSMSTQTTYFPFPELREEWRIITDTTQIL